MRTNSVQQQPKLGGEIMRTADPTLMPLLKQLDEMHGMGLLLQTQDGGRVPVRLNTGNKSQVIEVFIGGRWQELTGATSGSADSISGESSASTQIEYIHDSSPAVYPSDAVPQAWSYPASAGSSALYSRGDHKHPDLQVALDQTVEQLLRGSLSTGKPTPITKTYNFNNTASANNGVLVIGNSLVPVVWSTDSTTIYTTYQNLTLTFLFYTSGGNVVLDRSANGTSAATNVGVTLDGVAQTAWNQSTTRTYTLSNLAAGVHTLVITSGTNTTYTRLAQVQFPAYDYQGVGMPGDAAQIVYMPSSFKVTTLGIGPTNNGASATQVYGEAITPKLPLGSYAPYQAFARSSCIPAGATFAAPGGTGLLDYPFIGGFNRSYAYQRIVTGTTFALSANAQTRGYKATGGGNGLWLNNGMDSASSIISLCFLPCIAVITATGSGSRFNVGDLCLMMFTTSNSGTIQAVGCDPGDTSPMDFYKLA